MVFLLVTVFPRWNPGSLRRAVWTRRPWEAGGLAPLPSGHRPATQPEGREQPFPPEGQGAHKCQAILSPNLTHLPPPRAARPTLLSDPPATCLPVFSRVLVLGGTPVLPTALGYPHVTPGMDRTGGPAGLAARCLWVLRGVWAGDWRRSDQEGTVTGAAPTRPPLSSLPDLPPPDDQPQATQRDSHAWA